MYQGSVRNRGVVPRGVGILAACLGVAACAPDSAEEGPAEASTPAAATTPALEPATDTSGHLVVGETRVYYTAFGSGPPVLLIHGGPGLDQAYMRPWLDGIGAFARAVYYDQRGTGGSTGPVTPDEVTFDHFVEDIDRIREAMGWERLTVLGHSWGAILAVAYAMAHEDRLDGMILMSPAEPGTEFAAQAQLNQQQSRSEEDGRRLREIMSSEAFAAGDPEAVSEVFRIAFRGTLADPTDLDKLDLDLAESTARGRGQVTAHLQQSMAQPDWWDDLPGLDVPTLILHGRHDPLPVEMAHALGDSLPDARVVILRDSGHFPFAEEPGRVMEEIRAFVTRPDPGSSSR